MARTSQEIQGAMRRAMDAGDDAAVAQLRSMLTEAYQTESPSATEGMGRGEQFLAGVGRGMTNIVRQGGNILGVNSDEEMDDAAKLDKSLMDTGAGQAGSFVGEMAATAPIGGLAGGAARMALPMARGGGALALAARGAAQGGAEGFLSSGPGQRVTGGLAGAAGGAALPMAAGWVGRKLARGVEPVSAARKLMAQGVDLTPSQMNPGSGMGQLEQASKSLPFVGGGIEEAQNAAREGWRGVARQKVLAPGAANSSSMEDLYKGFEPAYDKAKGFPVGPRIMNTAGPDVPLADFPKNTGAFTRAAEDKSIWAGKPTRKTSKDWLGAQLTKLPDSGKGAADFDSEKLLRMRSDIRDKVRALKQSPNPEPGAMEILQAAEQRVTDALGSQLPPDAMDALKAADQQYRRFKVVDKASDAARSRGSSEFTPTELARSANKAEDDDLWKLANQGKQVFDQGAPATGARAVTLGAAGLLNPKAALALPATAAMLATGKTGRRIAGGQTAPQQAALKAALAAKRKLGYQGRDLARLYTSGLGAESLADFYGD
jgi:hypothetical protein